MVLSKEEAKRLSIISVAEQLGMELKRTGSYSYNWVEHDSFVIDAKKNEFYWNSRTEFGDVIQLVQTIRGVSYKEAMHFLETGEFKAVDVEAQTASKEPFSYHLERYERQDFSASRRYLKAQRGLSDDTINFFISQGSIAEAIRKKGDYFEPVIVFKYKDNTSFLAGASLQGIVENREHYPERGRLKQIMRNSDGQLGFSIDIGNPKRLVFAEAPIDLMSYYELHKDRLQDVRLVAMDGVKEGIISRRFMELYAEIDAKSYQVNQNTGKALELVARTTNYFKDGQHQDMITLAVDNDMAGHKFITSLQEKGIPVQIAIPPILQRDQEKEDWNDFLKGRNNTPKELAHVYTVDEKSWYYQGFFEKELALAKAQELTADDVKAFVSARQLTKEEVHQEYTRIVNQEKERKHTMSEVHEAQEQIQSTEKTPESTQEQMNDRASGGEGYSQPDAVGSAEPEAEPSATFEQTVTSHPTSPYRYLQFSTNFEEVQRRYSKYHPITQDDLKKMNQYAGSIQRSSQWYLEELANSKVYYFYSNNGEVNLLDVSFKQENFLHLTGIRPIVEGKKASDFVVDFAEGRGNYNQIMVSNSLKEKLQVIPMLEDILDSKSFVLDNLDEVRIAQRLNFSEAIKSKDEDFLLLFKDIGEERVPASLMKIKKDLKVDVEKTDGKVILGIFRERNGHIEQLSINEDYIKDGGKELQSIMENGLFEGIQPNEIDKNNYNVRLQWAEKHKDGSILPFSETEMVDYQSFATELYKQNNIYYDKHHASVSDRMNQVEGASYTPITKVQFALYSPDGELIQDSIRYNIGEEINPIAHKERLGTREMREHPELMKIDGSLFNQYHLERLVSELDISQFSYALEDTPYADQLLSQLPYGDLKNSPIGFTDSSHDSRLGFISFDGSDSVEVENLSAWFEKLGVRDSPQEQVALVEKWQKEVNDLSEKVEQTIANVREEFEKLQVKDSQETLDNRYEKIYQYNRKDERDRDLDGDGISNSDEMLQGTDPYNAASNHHKKQEDRERRTDVEAETGAIITDAIATKSSEQTISQLVANKDTKALAEHLKEGMKNYLDSEQFKSFLDTMSKFHNYSLNNIHLLKMQNPNVSRVASFNKWKTDFDRTVKKGSKALKIWVPYQVKTSIPVHQKELSFSPSENETEEKAVTVTRFKLGNVFDVSQTEGKELPKAINELTGDVKDYEDLYRAAKAVSMDNQVPISFEEIKRESTNGYYSPDENRIVISKGLKGQEQILKTIFHEMAHADLHRGSNAQYGDDQYRKQELQAESVAYVVANHFGFDTSSYSFGYLAIWAKDKNGFEDMVEQLQVVQKEAKSLIDRMDAKLELVKNKTVTKDKFADKLQQAKEKSEQLGNQKEEAVKQVEEKKSLSSPR
ncbi:PBECR4 domain-containing protein [Streptococcus pneumoniae]|uniref:PBECR4 domain-containing protein n=1 Tax=Streptococcus pneumoniae TaxID=1313 RepID=UPI0005E62815|nr:PBECR4 domain-containing protein [Streptococcus pneumoniae]CIS53703.1 DNA primase [Streptococcus pneumoniae]CIT09424.1 DNA primase [Streptococcus pneumoniae]CIV02047.1 DNA primase [Streptococcus pneumoniae]CIV42849.1 DNA primase [Streptococcus pneumoniae]CIW88374.1 DNA primase [Streptococcus pneumoniae]